MTSTDYACTGGTPYCTPDDVSEILGMLDNITGQPLVFTDRTNPTEEAVWRRIQAESDKFDAMVRTSWQTKRHVNQTFDRGTEWVRNSRWQVGAPLYDGGWVSQLNADIKEWDPELGDKLEKRYYGNQWVDITNEKCFWFDRPTGRFYYTLYNLPTRDTFRITYRTGKDEPIPPDVRDAIAGAVAIWIMRTDLYRSAIGAGQGLTNKNDIIKGFQDQYDMAVRNHMEVIVGGSVI